jgi:hypothetical protein
MNCKPYPSAVFDEEWEFVAPHLTLMTPDAPRMPRESLQATCRRIVART